MKILKKKSSFTTISLVSVDYTQDRKAKPASEADKTTRKNTEPKKNANNFGRNFGKNFRDTKMKTD